MKTWLIGSDLDGTLIYADNDPEVELGTQAINAFVQKHSETHTLVYVTGRHFERAYLGVRDFGLIEPKFYICDVGTSIYKKDTSTSSFILDEKYRTKLAKSWDESVRIKLMKWLQSNTHLTLQEDDRQREFKLCYYVSPDISADRLKDSVLERITEEFKLQAIYSTDPQNNIGYLDILPKCASKEAALSYLAKEIGVTKSHIVYAGDSGNDLSVCRAGIKFIAPKKVGQEVESFFLSKESEGCLYFRATKSYAFGVLEGLKYFKVF